MKNLNSSSNLGIYSLGDLFPSDLCRLTRDDPNFSGAFTVDVLYFEGEEFKSDGIFIDYYVDEEDEDGGVTYSAPKRVRFASYNIKTGVKRSEVELF